MKIYSSLSKILLLTIVILLSSCTDLSKINEKPNDIYEVNSDLYVSTVLTGTVGVYYNSNYTGSKISTTVQHLQQDIHGTSEVNFSWSSSSWGSYYDLLRTNKKLLNQATEKEEDYYKGMALVMKSFLFGNITDTWGDCPYSEALRGDEGLFFPKYDHQEDIYKGIITDLEAANVLLSKEKDDYILANSINYDVVYHGEPAQWRKFANSLKLRYYMRLSEKLPSFAQEGIENILSKPAQYPIFIDNYDNAKVEYVGNNTWDSWPGGTLSDPHGIDYRRRKPCQTIVDTLKSLQDPRLKVWVLPVDIQIIIEEPPYSYPDEEDITVDDKRYIHDNAEVLNIQFPDTSLYVGIPANLPDPHFFNLATTLEDGTNPHASYLSDMYHEDAHEFVNASFMTYAEVCFIKAEAAHKGWSTSGSASVFYNAGVRAAMTQYGIEDSEVINYLSNTRAQYNNSLERLMEQKWISLWLSPEAWFDYRRNGLPDLQTNSGALYQEIPIRFIYGDEESLENRANWEDAINRLEQTEFSSQADHHYSKIWVLQGTGNPF